MELGSSGCRLAESGALWSPCRGGPSEHGLKAPCWPRAHSWACQPATQKTPPAVRKRPLRHSNHGTAVLLTANILSRLSERHTLLPKSLPPVLPWTPPAGQMQVHSSQRSLPCLFLGLPRSA